MCTGMRDRRAYREAMAADPLLKLLPYGLGGTAVLAVSLWAAKLYFGKLIDTLASRTPDGLARLAGRRPSPLGRRYKRYRRAVQARYATHSIGFGESGTIDIREVYVPLQYDHAGRREDIYERIRGETRTVVLGPAGAGKSLLLKNSMLLWAADRDRGRLPVLIELHRYSGAATAAGGDGDGDGATGGADLVSLVVEELCRPRTRAAGRVRAFVARALEEGRLRLLFDGLDEVSRDDHDRVVLALRDFAASYPDCQMIVTCRNAAYYGELAPEFGHVVRVAPLDDASIRRFLWHWPGIGAATDADRVFGTLRRSAPLIRLARNPLLLTIIAHLQTGSLDPVGGTLPNSRPEFYQRAISHLLARDRVMGRPITSVYKPSDKLAVLQRVALAVQEQVDGDRLTIGRARLIAITAELLASTLNLGPEHVDPLLDEIIDRSQLLERADEAGSRFRFPHLTLQEFLAAQALARDVDGLLGRYTADPDSWRDTVRLWCAEGSADCTEVVRAVFAMDGTRHRVLALECLADAARIDAAFGAEVIASCLASIDAAGGAVWRAFAAVAADGRPRGNAVLELLTGTAEQGPPAAREAALSALSASGRPEAADYLAAHADGSPVVQACLREMGEPAVEALSAAALDGALWAVDALAGVATPAAAQRLAGLLWHAAPTATRAAWRLAALLPYPDVEEALRGEPGLAAPADPPLGPENWWYPWIWAPFAGPDDGALPQIAGRIAYLIDGGRNGGPLRPLDVPADAGTIDTRVGLPVAGISASAHRILFALVQHSRLDPLAQDVLDEAHRQRPGLTRATGIGPRVLTTPEVLVTAPGAAVAALRAELFAINDLPADDRRTIEALRWPVQATLLATILGVFEKPHLDPGTWRTVRQAPRPSAWLWWTARVGAAASVALIALVGTFRAVATIAGTWPTGPLLASWAVAVLTAGLLAALPVRWWLLRRHLALETPVNVPLALGSLVYLSGYDFVLTLVTCAERAGWPATLLGLAALGALTAVPAAAAYVRDGRSANPLRECLAADALAVSGRTSVLAAAPPATA
ncbi:NACHT domain-containing protein [Actinomadura sp. J1-007]|nr:NACHT domain-containing protein [Actinomadura sp. J1-007]